MIDYVCARVGGVWLARVCRNLEEAVELQGKLERAPGGGLREDVSAFAGQASDLEAAHWQLREALGRLGHGADVIRLPL